MAQANVSNTLVVPVETKVSPYFDDFDESKNFHRILFRPGYPVQARELTQLQTILQNQIERFGKHIFVNGSSVIGGKLDITDIVTLNVQPEYANSFINISDFKDKTITLSSSNTSVIARVLQTSLASDTEPAALHVKYLSGSEFSGGDVIKSSNGIEAALTANNATANGTMAFIYDSIYFMQGYFIKVPSHSVIVSKYDNRPNTRVGLELVEDFITENSDSSLLDPALESSNYQAPGAARYKVELALSTRSLDSEDDEKFIQISKIENGIIKEKVTTPIYSEIEEVLARRTYNESGNYVVRPFNIRIQDSLTDPANNLVAFIDAGKAYLYGYELETLTRQSFEIPRARAYKSRINYDNNMNYGNYVLVDDLTGNFNTNFGIIDLHSVEKNLVNTSSQAAYNSTKIGTARLKDLNFYSGSANTAQRIFELYFTDTKFNTLTGTAGNTTVAINQIHLGNTSSISNVDEAYTGAIIRITGGSAEGDSPKIISYNGASKIANVSPNFIELTDNTSTYSINFAVKDVDSFIQNINYTSGTSSNASVTVSTLSKADANLLNDTLISEPNFLNGYFQYPDKYVTPGITNSSYIYRKIYSGIQFTVGESSVITASTDEEFEGATATSNTASTVMDNWLVIVTDPLSSGRAVGEQVAVTATISNSVPEQAVLSTGQSESFIATVYAKINAKNSSAVARVKTLVLANTQTFTSDTVTAYFDNSSTGSNTAVYLNSGQVVIKDPSPTEWESLYISDVITGVKVYSSTTRPTAGSSLTTLSDVSNRYIIELGQTPYLYDHAKIKLKPGFANPSGYIIVCLRYYKSSNDVGYFSVDSYPSLNTIVIEEGKNIGTGYNLIPKIGPIKFSDAIDFRPVRPNASNNESYTFTSVRSPIAATDFTSDYSYYIERIDRFILSLNGEIRRIEGVPSISAVPPQIPDKSLLLHTIKLSSYTETPSDARIYSEDHRRYTMKDISNIDRRLKNIEYSVTLNSLEKRAEDILIQDVFGLDRTKYGILAESFRSHLLGDVESPDYLCAVDINKKYAPREGMLTPRIMPSEVSLSLNEPYSDFNNVAVYRDKTLLSFTTEPAITQPVATKWTPVAEYLFADFVGSIVCDPESDIWKDVRVLPPEVITLPPIQPTFPPVTGGDTPITSTPTPYCELFPTDPNCSNVLPNDPTVADKVFMLTNCGAYGGVAGCESQVVGNFVTGVDGNLQTVGMTTAQYVNLVNQLVVDKYNTQQAAGMPVVGNPQLMGNYSLSEIERIERIYAEVLNRPPDADGLIYWLEEARYKWSNEEDLRTAFLWGGQASGELEPEYLNEKNNVTTTPGTILDPNQAQVTSTINTVNHTGGVVSGAYTETAYASNTRDLTPEELISGIYWDILGRAPDDDGYQYWLNQLTSGAEDVKSIVNNFTISAENTLQETFGNDHGYNVDAYRALSGRP